ncbi:unnamed protein product, partial [Mesorhabditis spiculigera]
MQTISLSFRTLLCTIFTAVLSIAASSEDTKWLPGIQISGGPAAQRNQQPSRVKRWIQGKNALTPKQAPPSPPPPAPAPASEAADTATLDAAGPSAADTAASDTAEAPAPAPGFDAPVINVPVQASM